MRALITVELRRLLARRLLRWMTILVVAGIAFAGVASYIASDDSPAGVAQARAQYRADVISCIQNSEREAASGEISGSLDYRSRCEEEVWLHDPRFDYSELNWVLSSFGIPLMMLGWLVGASSMGAEWHSRSITTLLTWEPRRTRVFGAKVLAAGTTVFAWVLGIQVALAAAMYPAAAFEGTTAGIDGEWWTSLAALLVRSSALAALAAVLGLSLATIGRNTAAALGVGFAYLAVVESLVRGFKPLWADWLVGDNVALFIVGPADVTHLTHSQAAAGVLLLAYGAALAGLALAVFRRREVA